MTNTSGKTAYTTLNSRTSLALGDTRSENLCHEVECGLSTPATTGQVRRVLNAIGVDKTTAHELRSAFKGAPMLVLDILAETWRPRTTPTRCDVFFQMKDVQYQVTQTIERIRYEKRTRKTETV